MSPLCHAVGVGESDMELDLLDSDSDSDHSNHSNQDNASVQRSAVTAATAGSDAGKLMFLDGKPMFFTINSRLLLPACNSTAQS